MRLTEFEAGPFRLLREVRLLPAAGVNLIVGRNAQGKTTLLEAICYLTMGRSFRTSNDRECLPIPPLPGVEPFARSAGAFERSGVLHRIEVTVQPGRKTLWLDSKPQRTLSQYVGRFPTVVLLPEDLALVRGAATPRRGFLDMTASQVVPGVLAALKDYGKAMANRNAKMRHGAGVADGEFDAFETIMANAAARIIRARAMLVRQLVTHMVEPVRRLSGGTEELVLSYTPSLPPESLMNKELIVGPSDEPLEQHLLELWRRHRSKDIARGMTAFGPHRDDLRIEVTGREARSYASQGQCRTLALALRLAEAKLLQAMLGAPPMLLFDDVLGELDEGRSRRFLAMLEEFGSQAFLATTDAGLAKDLSLPVGRRITIEGGQVRGLE